MDRDVKILVQTPEIVSRGNLKESTHFSKNRLIPVSVVVWYHGRVRPLDVNVFPSMNKLCIFTLLYKLTLVFRILGLVSLVDLLFTIIF